MGKDLNNKNSKVISFDYVMVRSSQHCGHDNVTFLKTVSFFLLTATPPSVLDYQTSRYFDFQTIQRQLCLHWRQPSWTNSQMSWQAYPLKVSQWHYAPRDQTSCIEQKPFAAKITLSAQSHMAVSASFSNLFWPQTCLLTIQTLPTIRNKKKPACMQTTRTAAKSVSASLLEARYNRVATILACNLCCNSWSRWWWMWWWASGVKYIQPLERQTTTRAAYWPFKDPNRQKDCCSLLYCLLTLLLMLCFQHLQQS